LFFRAKNFITKRNFKTNSEGVSITKGFEGQRHHPGFEGRNLHPSPPPPSHQWRVPIPYRNGHASRPQPQGRRSQRCEFCAIRPTETPTTGLSGLGLNFLLASASFTLSHTLSLDSYCRPTTGKSSSPAGLSTLVYTYVVDCTPASPRILLVHTQVSR
jgi:hypothetical protein